jgi:hypothetical protein
MKLRRNFSQWAHPIYSIWPKTHVLWCFASFHYCTKIDAKRAELVPFAKKFTKRSCVAIFHNERMQSTPFDQKLMFWGVSHYFDTIRQLIQNGSNWSISKQVRQTKLCRNFSKRTHLKHYIWRKTHLLGCFTAFCYCTTIDPKRAEQVQVANKLARPNCVVIFRYECTQSTPFDAKLIFWGVSHRFVTARKSMQNGRTGAFSEQVR